MPVQLLFSVLKNIQQLCDKFQSHYVFFTLALMLCLLFWCSDGTTQALGTCLRDFRNKPYPIRAKITYYKKTLTVGEMMKTLMLPQMQMVSSYMVWRDRRVPLVQFVRRIIVLSSGDDQQWLHSQQRRLWVLHKGGQHDHSHWRLFWHFGRHWRFGR